MKIKITFRNDEFHLAKTIAEDIKERQPKIKVHLKKAVDSSEFNHFYLAIPEDASEK